MKTRIITASIGIPIVLALVYAGGWMFFVAVAILSLLSMRELELAMRRENENMIALVAYPVLISILWTAWRYSQMASRSATAAPLVWALPVLLLVVGVLCFTRRGRISLVSVAMTQLAVMYVGLFAFFLLLRHFPAGGLYLFWLALLGVWMGDTVAYFAGRKWGRRALTPLSPGKTLEGAAVGVLASALLCLLLALLWRFDFRHGLALGVLIGLAAPLGDLIESFWKRELGVKDLGTLLPGHGGVLDRCDSLLLAMFVTYLYALWQL